MAARHLGGRTEKGHDKEGGERKATEYLIWTNKGKICTQRALEGKLKNGL